MSALFSRRDSSEYAKQEATEVRQQYEVGADNDICRSHVYRLIDLRHISVA